MSKRKEAVDPFGLSLLDVLSNALGGVILLMMIVAVTIKGNDSRKLNLPQEADQGERYTEVKFKPKNTKVEYFLLTAQIDLIGGGGSLSLDGDIKNEILTKSTSPFRGESREWLVIRQGKSKGRWQVRLDPKSIPTGDTFPDSVSVMITLDNKVSCSEVVEIGDRSGDYIMLLDVIEKENLYIIAGRPCNLEK